MSIKTGYMVRIQRNGEWANHDIMDLTKEEIEEFFTYQWDTFPTTEYGVAVMINWIRDLVGWIKHNVHEA